MFSYYDLNAINTDAVFADCYFTDWNYSWYFLNVNNKLELFTQNIANIFNAHGPLKRKVVQKCNRPWFRGEVKNAINQRNKFYAKWKSDPFISNWILFNISRNKVLTITRQAKCVYYRNQFGTNLSNKEFWKHLRTIGFNKNRNKCNFTPRIMNQTFSKPFTKNNETTFKLNSDLIFNGNNLSLICFSNDEVYKSI